MARQRQRTVNGEPPQPCPDSLDDPYLHAPTWPWQVAGWAVAAILVLWLSLASR